MREEYKMLAEINARQASLGTTYEVKEEKYPILLKLLRAKAERIRLANKFDTIMAAIEEALDGQVVSKVYLKQMLSKTERDRLATQFELVVSLTQDAINEITDVTN